MTRILPLFAALVLCGVSSVRAADGAAQKQPPARRSALEWLKNWREGLEKTPVSDRQQKGKASRVAAVRGASQNSDAKEPYWKDGMTQRAQAQSEAERKALREVADLAIGGRVSEAVRQLDAFEAAHPRSAHSEDIRTARQQLKLLSQEAPPPPPAAKSR